MCWYAGWFHPDMSAPKKVTVEIPEALLRKARRSTGQGITATVRKGSSWSPQSRRTRVSGGSAAVCRCPSISGSCARTDRDCGRHRFVGGVSLRSAAVLSRARKARLADTLIAQSCLDYDVPLISRDRDFRSFARTSPLRLLA